MTTRLHVLLVEDSDADAALLLRELRRGGFEVVARRVQTASEMEVALGEGGWDIVLSDYSLPTFSAPAALALLHRTGPDIPFLIVSGSVSEEIAVESLRAGAHDFFGKDRLARLCPAVERALGEARDRARRRDAERDGETARVARERAEAASSAKSLALATVAHELRNPLGAVLGFADLLADASPSLDELHREHVERIREGTRHMLHLIEDLLDLSKIEARRMRLALEPTSVAAAVERAVRLTGTLARRQGVELRIVVADALPTIEADPLRLVQILCNLLSNAVKFSPRGGDVELDVAADIAGGIVLAVRDTGVGISPEDLPRLFNDFEQLTTTAETAAMGTGLGLALTRRLVELHGGSVAVESAIGRGSVFTVRLPSGLPTPVASEPAWACEPRRILIVEDEPLNRTLLRAVLLPLGCALEDVATAAAAEASIAARRPDVVVVDLNGPDGGGLRVLRAVRRDPALSAVPVVVVTAEARPGDRERLLAEGFDAYLAKPIDARACRTAIGDLLHREVLQQEQSVQSVGAIGFEPTTPTVSR